MNIRRIAGPGLALLVGIGLVTGIGLSARQKNAAERTPAAEAEVALISVKGLIGSEKESFYRDPRAVAAFRRLGMTVEAQKAGSREISQRADLSSYDFGHPSGAPAAFRLQKTAKATRVFQTFYTPMAVASWKALLPTLEANGFVKQSGGNWYILDLPRLLQIISEGKRWRELHNSAAYNTGKSVLISSTDVRTSNSAAMFLALSSYLFNDSNVVQSDADIAAVLPRVKPLFLKQGFQEASSAGPFEDYVGMGMGKAPLVFVYESQFLEHQARLPQPNPDMVLLYPAPTVFAKHILVPLSPKGERLGEALERDPELQKLAAEYGFRSARPEHFQAFLKSKGLAAPATLVDVIDPPGFEILEKMIEAIAADYR